MGPHMRNCSKRTVFKMEYVNNPTEAVYDSTKLKLVEFDNRPDQEYIPSKGNFSKAVSSSV